MKNLLYLLFSTFLFSTNSFAVIPGAVTGLTCTVNSSSSITATWVAGSGSPSYYYARIDTSPTYTGDHSGSVVIYAPTVSNTFTGLSSCTTYYVHVAALDGSWAWSGSVNSSGCSTTGSSLTVPFTEGFESGYTDATSLGCPVSQVSVSGAATWMANSSASSYNRSSRSGSFNATLYYSNDDWMFFPITFTSGVTYLFSMYARQDMSTSTYSNITVKYGSSNSAAAMTSTIVASTGIVDGTYQNLTGTFTPGSSGVLYIGIKGYMNGTPYYISVDDISITQMVSTSTDYFRSLATGNWQTAGTWQSSPDNVNWMTSTLVPTSAATSVNVQSGHTVTVNGISTSGPLTITGTGNLTLSSNLTVTGTVTGASTSTIAVGTSTLTVSGTTTISGTLSISTGTVDANGTFNATSGSVTFTGAGNLYLGGAVTSLGTFTESTSTVIYDYAGSQNVDADGYYNLTFTSAGTKTSQGTTTVGNTLTVNTGSTYALVATTVTVTGAATIPGTITASTGTLDVDGTFNATSGSVTFSSTGALKLAGSVTSLGTFTESTSTTWYNNAGAQNVLPETYYNLYIDGSGIKTATGTVNISGTMTVNAGTYSVASTTTTVTGATSIVAGQTLSIGTGTYNADGTFTANTTGIITFSGAGNLIYSNSAASPNLGVLSTTAGTVTYDYAGAQTITTDNYFNLTTSGSGAKTLVGNIVVSGDITLSGGSLTQGTYNINVAGNWTSSGNYYTEGTGIVTFDGTGASTVTGTSSTYSSAITTINSNTFESSTGWTLTGGSGNWNLITPSGTNSPAADNSAVGTQCLKTCAASTAYSNSSNYILTSPTISLSGYTGTSLSFYMWMDAESSTTLYDGGLIEVYNGSSWSSISGSVVYDGTISSGTYSGSSGWTYDRLTWTLVTVDISAYDGNASFQIRYKFSSDVSGTGGGWAIDDFAVTGYTTIAYTGEVFNKFTTNKTGGGYVQLSSNVMAGTNFTLTSGLIKTGAYTLSLGNPSSNATLSGGSSSAYIVAYDNSGTIGSVKHFINSAAGTVYTYPIGDATNYTPFTFTLTTATLSNAYLTLYTKATKIAGLSSITNNYIARHWNMTESGFTSPTYTISYNYVDGDIVGSETGMLPIKKSGSTWYKPTGSSFTNGTVQGTGSFTAASNLLSWSGLTTFSLVGGIVNAAVGLPIELISFKGNKLGNDNELTWTTASELNNDYFTVERTYDGINFEYIGKVNGAGNSTQNSDYFTTDYNVRPVINYYRLRQTDFDGKSTMSEVIAIDNSTVETSKEVVMKTNVLGQEVNDQYRGMVVIVYADGSSVKIIQ